VLYGQESDEISETTTKSPGQSRKPQAISMADFFVVKNPTLHKVGFELCISHRDKENLMGIFRDQLPTTCCNMLIPKDDWFLGDSWPFDFA